MSDVITRNMGLTSAERARAHKARLAERGFVQCNIWVPAHVVADFNRAAELCRTDPTLTLARLVNRETGRLLGLKGWPAAHRIGLGEVA